MKRGTFNKLNTKLMVDVIAAYLITDKAPALISSFMPIDPSLQAVAGVGAAYFVGKVAKRPDISNAGIALGVVNFIEPFLDELLGGMGMGTTPQQGVLTPGVTLTPGKSLPPVKITPGVSDYLHLSEYTSMPGVKQSYQSYGSSYN